MPENPVVSARVDPTLTQQLARFEAETDQSRSAAVNELLAEGLAAKAANGSDCGEVV
jgi:hypothetical protein